MTVRKKKKQIEKENDKCSRQLESLTRNFAPRLDVSGAKSDPNDQALMKVGRNTPETNTKPKSLASSHFLLFKFY